MRLELEKGLVTMQRRLPGNGVRGGRWRRKGQSPYAAAAGQRCHRSQLAGPEEKPTSSATPATPSATPPATTHTPGRRHRLSPAADRGQRSDWPSSPPAGGRSSLHCRWLPTAGQHHKSCTAATNTPRPTFDLKADRVAPSLLLRSLSSSSSGAGPRRSGTGSRHATSRSEGEEGP